jgi:predicted Zn-dependent protease
MDRTRCENEFGITLEMAGRLAAAESAFVSLLAHAPHDSRALTNLGNVALLRGDAGLALAFYDRALARGEDPGVRLDRAAALLLGGDVPAAQQEAARGVQAAGGAPAAAQLMGISLRDSATTQARGADSKSLSSVEVAALLQQALEVVPVDTTRLKTSAVVASQPDSLSAPATRPKRRSAGPRSSEGGDTALALYWKRD